VSFTLRATQRSFRTVSPITAPSPFRLTAALCCKTSDLSV